MHKLTLNNAQKKLYFIFAKFWAVPVIFEFPVHKKHVLFKLAHIGTKLCKDVKRLVPYCMLRHSHNEWVAAAAGRGDTDWLIYYSMKLWKSGESAPTGETIMNCKSVSTSKQSSCPFLWKPHSHISLLAPLQTFIYSGVAVLSAGEYLDFLFGFLEEKVSNSAGW